MDRVRPAMLIAALVVDVGRRLPRRGGSAVAPSACLIRVWARVTLVQIEATGVARAGQTPNGEPSL